MRGSLLFCCLLVMIGSVWASCSLTCPSSTTCYAPNGPVLDCLNTIPFNKEWATATIDTLSQSLENFGFGALYHATGPPYSIQLDVLGELKHTQSMIDRGQFNSDIEFQEHVQSIFQSTQDAHTRYSKPVCYAATFVQPFAFDLRIEPTAGSANEEPVLYLMSNVYTDTYATYYPHVPVKELIGAKVELLNGVEFTTEISGWADTHETRSNNRGINFNSAIRSYLYRSAVSFNIVPLNDLKVTLTNGKTITLPWLASYTQGLGDVNYCKAVSTEANVDPAAPYKRSIQYKTPMVDLKPSFAKAEDHHPSLLTPPAPLRSEVMFNARPDREVIIAPNSEFMISCFVQTIDAKEGSEAGVSRVLVMKVASFSPPGFYLTAWEGFLNEAQQCLSATYDVVVVDVMQNGGGYVCLGLRLIELLVEDFYNDHTKVQMHYDLPHSALMDKYIDVVNAPDPYPDPEAVEQILNKETQQAFPDGKSYYYPGRKVVQGGVVSWRTNAFSLNCTQAEAMPSVDFKPFKFMTPDRLVILTDGTCGSTCASFTKIPQEAGKATFVGAGGLWGEGMDVSSFAGGFVCNPGYLANIAAWSGTSFPKFLTNQRWQFGWAAWYSAKFPSRPVQFTVQTPDHREPFWGFPHASIDSTVTTEMVSVLYDKVIAGTIQRLANANKAAGVDRRQLSIDVSPSSSFVSSSLSLAPAVCGGLLAGVMVMLGLQRMIAGKQASKTLPIVGDDSSML